MTAVLNTCPASMRATDSVSVHLSKRVLAAFCAAALRCAFIPGGLKSFIRAGGVTFASRHRVGHDCHYLLVSGDEGMGIYRLRRGPAGGPPWGRQATCRAGPQPDGDDGDDGIRDP